MSVESELAAQIIVAATDLGSRVFHKKATGATPDFPLAWFECVTAENSDTFGPVIAFREADYRIHVLTEDVRSVSVAEAHGETIGKAIAAGLRGFSATAITNIRVLRDFDGPVSNNEPDLAHRIVDLTIHSAS